VDPGPLGIIIPQPDGKPVTKPFSDCTRNDLNTAINGLKEKPVVMPADDAVKVERMHEALLEILGADTRTEVKGSFEHGETWVSISRLPMSELSGVLEAFIKAQGNAG